MTGHARWIVAALGVAAVAAGAVVSHRAITPGPGEAASGVFVEGVRLEAGDDARGVVRELSDRWLDEEVWLEAGPLTERLRRAEVGLRIDVEACARAIRDIGRSGDPMADLATLLRARLGHVRVALAPVLDRDALRGAIEAIAARFDRPARPAEIDDAGRLVAPPEPGRAIDVEQSLEEISDDVARGERRFVLVTRERPAPVDASRFARALEPAVIGSYVTRYRMRGEEGPRAANVRTAAEALDGAIVPAGGRLSFNDRVGPRTPSRGYQVAHVIYDGEMIDGIGGGVCQVASTFHAAAFLAGLPIVEHVPHSRPSTYIPMGLDATVVYPDVDLVIANPLPVPLTVRAHANAGRLTVELWARARPLDVEWRRDVLARASYEERVIEDPTLASGEAVVSQDGGPGFVIERLRVLHAPSGDVTERRTLRYPPTDRVVRMAPGTVAPLVGPAFDGEALAPTSAVASPVEGDPPRPNSTSTAASRIGDTTVPAVLE